MKRTRPLAESRTLVLACVLVASLLTSPASGSQPQKVLAPSALGQSDIDIAVVIGSDVHAQQLVSDTLRDISPSNRRLFVLAHQIRVEWLPQIDGVEFVRLSNAEAAASLSACGT